MDILRFWHLQSKQGLVLSLPPSELGWMQRNNFWHLSKIFTGLVMLNCWVANMHDKNNFGFMWIWVILFFGQFVLILVKSLFTVVMQHLCEYITMLRCYNTYEISIITHYNLLVITSAFIYLFLRKVICSLMFVKVNVSQREHGCCICPPMLNPMIVRILYHAWLL